MYLFFIGKVENTLISVIFLWRKIENIYSYKLVEFIDTIHV